MSLVNKIIKEAKHTKYDNSTGKPFWGDIGAGILPICTTTKRILVGLRSIYVNEPNTWGTFGGQVELREGEDIQTGALREFKEETQFSGTIRIIPSFIFKTDGFEYHNFLGVISSEFSCALDKETKTTKWLTFKELVNLPKKHFGLVFLLKNSSKQILDIIGE